MLLSSAKILEFNLFFAICFLASWQVSATDENDANEYCGTFACVVKGIDMKHWMNKSIDPCSDFYQFACGSFMERHTIDDAKYSLDIFDIREDQMNRDIQSTLKQSNSLVKSVQLASQIYSKCNIYGNNIDQGFLAVEDLVQNITSGWTVGQKLPQKYYQKSWYTLFVKTVTSSAISPIFNLSLNPDPKNSKMNIVTFNLVPFTIGDKELQNLTRNVKLIDAYRTFIVKSARLLNFNGTMDDKLLHSQVEEIIQLESSLAKVKSSIEDQKNPIKNYQKLTIGELSEKTKFDWFSKIVEPVLFQLNVTYKLSNKTEIIVTDLDYYVKAIQIVNAAKPETLDNYFGWKIVEDYSRYSSQQLQKFAFEFEQIKSGVRAQTPLNKVCFDLTNRLMPMAISRVYVDNHFTEKEKDAAKELITEVQNSYLSLIEKNSWLDEATRKKSLEKLRKSLINVAYPDWLLNDSKLDQYYGLYQNDFLKTILKEKNFLKTLSRFRVHQIGLEFSKLFEPIDFDLNWGIQPAVINAFYKNSQNSITIPAGILKSPFFNTEIPASVNFGSIGTVVGHEFTLALDNKGSQFDVNGNLNNWWTEQSRERFENQSQCFVEQYGAIRDETVHMNINGKLTLAQNIADNGGIREAFRAYKNYDANHSPSLKLAAVPAYNSDQLFFISYAQTWCALVRPEMQKYLLEYNEHSPSRFRVNVPLSNSADFEQAFHCPAGSPMNPAKKCQLW